MRYLVAVFFLSSLISCGPDGSGHSPFAGETTPSIQLNQVGYYPDQPVRFTVTGAENTLQPDAGAQFYVTDSTGDSTVYEGTFGDTSHWTGLAGVVARTMTVAPLPVGQYRIYVPGTGYSHPFRVAEDILREPFLGSVRGLYYQRASQELPERFAGQWARKAGHPDTAVRYHPSSGHREGTLSSPGGWYDAGDFNKYVLNGAFPVGQLLALFEDIGDPAPDGSLNIPESGNGRSDYLDEIKYELDWLLTMQDDDGGLFHKLTTLNFAGMVMPEAGNEPRYVVTKSVTATFDFAAAAAQAARIYRDYDATYADRLLLAARRAWAWGLDHPDAFYRNPDGVTTGQYGDDDAADERAWAAAELFATTGEQEFYTELRARPPQIRAGTGWTGYMANLAAFTLLRNPDRVPREYYDEVQGLVITLADSIVMEVDRNDYFQPLFEFRWGSNSDVLNDAMIVAAAHLREPKEEYVRAMRDCMNYILGHNPNGVSYLTGFGAHYPMNIHHRQSAADGVEEPVPGLLSGGPNTGQQDREDGTTYKSGAAPMQSWSDQTESYASNEICLNWNAPFTYVAGFLGAHPLPR